ncbi:unnamed protein product [Closterium sp. Yama58-4]|nr:unnamed protein product [Closterium sp. Yama58-4]
MTRRPRVSEAWGDAVCRTSWRTSRRTRRPAFLAVLIAIAAIATSAVLGAQASNKRRAPFPPPQSIPQADVDRLLQWLSAPPVGTSAPSASANSANSANAAGSASSAAGFSTLTSLHGNFGSESKGDANIEDFVKEEDEEIRRSWMEWPGSQPSKNNIIAFIGDSISRNFQQSISCLIAAQVAVEDWTGHLGPDSVIGLKIPSHNVRILAFMTPFLVRYTNEPWAFELYGLKPPKNQLIKGGNGAGQSYVIWTDVLDSAWTVLFRQLDVVVFMSGHWFLQAQGNTDVRALQFVSNNKPVNLNGQDAYRAVINRVKKFLDVEAKFKGIPMWLTYSPSHYRSSTYPPSCPDSKPLSSVSLDNAAVQFRSIELEMLQNTRFSMLDLTAMSGLRPDGHVQMYYGPVKNSKTKWDCLHWCLPGVPDAWSDVLQLVLQSRLQTGRVERCAAADAAVTAASHPALLVPFSYYPSSRSRRNRRSPRASRSPRVAIMSRRRSPLVWTPFCVPAAVTFLVLLQVACPPAALVQGASTDTAVYIVTLRSAPPIIAYNGGILGFAPTAPEAVAAAAAAADSSMEDDGDGDAAESLSESAASATGGGGGGGGGGATARPAGARPASSGGGWLGGVKDRLADKARDQIGWFQGQAKRMRNRYRPRLNVRSRAVRQFAELLRLQQLSVATSAKIPHSNLLYSFKYVSHGFAARLTPQQVSQLRQNPAVESIRQDVLFRPLTNYSPNFLQLPGTMWASAGGPKNAGENVIIGVIDTGIWPEHPSFSAANTSRSFSAPPARWAGSCTTTSDFSARLCTNKLIGAQVFNAGFRQRFKAESNAVDYSSARDSNGHGTWCAGAAVGNVVEAGKLGTVSGMAPRAHLAIYKVVWTNMNSGGYLATMVDINAAVDKAVADGVDVISISLGGADPNATYFDHVNYLNVNKAGVFVAFAAGNSGSPPSRVVYRTIDNFSPFYMTVGASSIARRGTYESSGESNLLRKLLPGMTSPFDTPDSSSSSSSTTVAAAAGAADASTAPAGSRSVLGGAAGGEVGAGTDANSNSSSIDAATTSLQVVFVEAQKAARTLKQRANARICAPLSLDPSKISGKVVLCNQGGSSIKAKAWEVAGKGGYAMIVLDPLGLPKNLGSFKIGSLPVRRIGMKETVQLRSFMAGSKKAQPKGIFSWLRKFVAASRAPVIASFSSTGPLNNPSTNPEPAPRPCNDIIKPDIVAPGVDLWSAANSELSNRWDAQYAQLSGTSMATPHIAGIAALLVQRYPNWTPAQLMSAMMTTATTKDNKGQAIQTSEHQLATPWDMGAGHINPRKLLDPGLTYNIAFKDYQNFLAGQDLNRAKLLWPSETFAPTSARNLNRPTISVAWLSGSAVVTRKVTSVFDQDATYVAKVVSPRGVDVAVDPQNFTISSGASVTYRITFTVLRTSPTFSYGSLTWEDEHDHSVRSILAVQPISQGD